MNDTIFNNIVDLLVQLSEQDPELKNGLVWLDKQAQQRGISIYDMVFEVLHKHDINVKAKDWLNTRN